MQTATTQNNTTVTTPEKATRPDFGAGRYSEMMNSVFNDAQIVFKLPSDKAEKLARQCGSDFGAAMRNAEVSAKVGKAVSKDGKFTLSEAAKVKGVTGTNSLHAMRAINYAAECGKYGFNWRATSFEVAGPLKEYLEQL